MLRMWDVILWIMVLWVSLGVLGKLSVFVVIVFIVDFYGEGVGLIDGNWFVGVKWWFCLVWCLIGL